MIYRPKKNKHNQLVEDQDLCVCREEHSNERSLARNQPELFGWEVCSQEIQEMVGVLWERRICEEHEQICEEHDQICVEHDQICEEHEQICVEHEQGELRSLNAFVKRKYPEILT